MFIWIDVTSVLDWDAYDNILKYNTLPNVGLNLLEFLDCVWIKLLTGDSIQDSNRSQLIKYTKGVGWVVVDDIQ